MATKTKTEKTVKQPTALQLAKDVLKWLEPGSKVKIRPRLNFAYVATKEQNADLQAVLKKSKTCHVCGMGALLAAKAFRTDEVNLVLADEFSSKKGMYCISGADCVSGLHGILNATTLLAIEEAFEHGEGVPPRLKSATARLRWICENIIKNKGKFVLVNSVPVY